MSFAALKQMGSVIDDEVVVKLADGWTIRSGVYPPDTPDALISGQRLRWPAWRPTKGGTSRQP
jgi:hypothetical protein